MTAGAAPIFPNKISSLGKATNRDDIFLKKIGATPAVISISSEKPYLCIHFAL